MKNMVEERHCCVLINSEIKKEIKKDNEALLGVTDTYYCLICGKTFEYGSICYSSFDEIDKLQKMLLDSYEFVCTGDKDLIIAIYNKIRINHPDISEEQMLAYISSALYNMETKYTPLERQKKRILRLDLQPEFNDWGKYSVIHYTE